MNLLKFNLKEMPESKTDKMNLLKFYFKQILPFMNLKVESTFTSFNKITYKCR